MIDRSIPQPDGLPTGAGTGLNDVADPHPEVHEDTDKVPHPGGADQHPEPDIGPNSYAHDGTPPPKPDYSRPTWTGEEE
ncbi:hypothetical protein [Devosia neptuniae]|jgi:hypothetical protein|uniref:hypothetical protein n=1 Tax=Devosia TaxID=46913 RepID=UPI0022B07CC6|nr:hypothetical protein [Devosia neptuniae]MCZ4344743.1 hypothetical protein [Devosia neptuniae]|tara:strand:- start:9955 stop:10191 length:237 start_codon:yes stop_codon:yes gene_type:complete